MTDLVSTPIADENVNGDIRPSSPDVSGLERIVELKRDGRLESEVVELQSVLAALPETDRPAASRLLSSFEGRSVDAGSAHRVVGVAVLGSTTVRGVTGALTAEMLRHGLVPAVRVGGFGRWSLELRDPSATVFEHGPHLTLCLLDASIVTDRLRAPWTVDDLLEALDDAYADLVVAVDTHGDARTLVVNTVPLPPRILAMLVDLESRGRAAAAWRRFNTALAELALDRSRLHVVDSESILCVTGPLSDERMAAYARVELGDAFLAEVARQVGHIVRSTRGMTRKCLALDLDGTLWGGILAEAGPHGIVLRDGPRGAAFNAVHDVVRQLAAQGVLVAALSKNDDAAVREVFATNDAMGLTEDDFVAIIANWDPKPLNLGELAGRLNIGTDSFVFVDDSASECGSMRTARPEVEVIRVDADEPALHVPRILRDGWFTTAHVTEEDRARPVRYRREIGRHELRATAGSVEDYLAALDTAVVVRAPRITEIPRVSQITQRTNQFNLTTVRMDEAAVTVWMNGPSTSVAAVWCSDRFGDHGMVGCLFLERDGAELHIRNFALSCRVLARGVETAILGSVVDAAWSEGAHSVVGWYRPSPKNGIVATLYSENGFCSADADADAEGRQHFVLTAGDSVPPSPYVRLTREDSPS
ncbi:MULTISPECIES: HAD-IIIC family phosphatase [Rhodococcus]|uniref:HAD-IIIC family phosphatase n=1 Tax=Rhodococcus TaxID=1827 RepID=UPI00200013DA|nr:MULTISPECIES: HAD-IIIC family phosphatase [Rhodococcus]UPK63097.1 HAD-IIIC family phosphatase [Rhodococcus pyridinivorans]